MSTNQLTEGDALALEQMVDMYGLPTVTAALAVICEMKAEHMRVNWQEPTRGRYWTRASIALTKAEHAVTRILE
jgi:hypothetical protein